MPIFGLRHKDAKDLEVYVDGVKQKFTLFANSDDGFAVVYVTEPAPTSKQPDRVKVKTNAKGDPLTETVWGKITVMNKATGKAAE